MIVLPWIFFFLSIYLPQSFLSKNNLICNDVCEAQCVKCNPKPPYALFSIAGGKITIGNGKEFRMIMEFESGTVRSNYSSV